MADGKQLCAASGLSDGLDFMAGIQSSQADGGRGTHLPTHLKTKTPSSHVVHANFKGRHKFTQTCQK